MEKFKDLQYERPNPAKVKKDFLACVKRFPRWRVTVDHALKIGFGTDQYELVKLDK